MRASAAKAIHIVGDASTRLKLKPLATEQLLEDEDDRLKGHALQVLWPNHLTVEELFQVLTPPKKRNFFGGYQWFLDYELVPQLQAENLMIALNWLKEQCYRRFGSSFEKLENAILFKAWENFDSSGVAEIFTQLALSRWKDHQGIIIHDSKLKEQFASSLLQNGEKRHKLINQAVLMISEMEENPSSLISSLARSIVIPEDIAWMLGCIEKAGSEQEGKNWSTLLMRMFRYPELMTEEAKAI